ncbi:hypothetical protein HW571_08475 [Agrobacterium genomosp. 3]|jgi:hypothetical protein|uniref:Uncharacterized protein n=2 Tax=Hyphomicrobiales TaxID=356 RepID=A0AA50CJB8_9HYPH|nr:MULTISPECIES: hypothetical protein [Hyphomicrobiales]KRA03867.1 hypothetical protein ASD74_23035 [Rhizobium sp. Root564]MBX8800197.1 hypothetical protein [Ochrobactrum sp. MR28]MBX8815809.1 hypothetical protein [Ochrobactrum sp. MR31]MCA1865706.1 hypothetical protein [Agrobacterium tomkonis]MCA1876058.1 hypothetical protein [Agrobacterium tumefaciens]PZU79235.1 MAG: hypothetical protein DI546_00995 [Rhizobium sp.]
MTLILLAISLSIALCVIAFNFAIYALPFMVGLTAFQHVYGTGGGFLMSGFAATVAALLSIGLVIAVLAFAKNPALRLVALAIFAVPAAIAGYALVYGITKNAIDSTIALNLLGGAGGLFIGIAAMLNLNAIGESALSR